MKQVLFIIMGASGGALLRWTLAIKYNPIISSIPLGTLIANLSGCFITGCLMWFALEEDLIRRDILIGLTTGFLGSLTTFSAFSAEVLFLVSRKEYAAGLLLICLHVIGSLLMVGIGFFATKALLQLGKS